MFVKCSNNHVFQLIHCYGTPSENIFDQNNYCLNIILIFRHDNMNKFVTALHPQTKNCFHLDLALCIFRDEVISIIIRPSAKKRFNDSRTDISNERRLKKISYLSLI